MTELEVAAPTVHTPFPADVNRISIPFLRVQERRWLLGSVDGVMVAAWMLAAYEFWRHLNPTSGNMVHIPWLWIAGAAAAWLAVSWLVGAYDLSTADRFSRAWRTSLTVTGAGWAGEIFANFLFPTTYPRSSQFMVAVAIPLSVVGWRGVYAAALKRPANATRLIVVGSPALFRALVDAVREQSAYYRVLGFVGEGSEDPANRLGSTTDLLEVCERLQAHRVVVGPDHALSSDLVEVLSRSIELGIEVTDFSAAYEEIAEKVAVEHAGDYWLAALPTRPGTSAIEDAALRALDIAGGCVGLCLTALLFPLIALAVAVESGRPIFYRQERLGRGGRRFTMWKFRSMRSDAENGTARWAAPSDCRATRVGAALRRTHLDELPQFWNVLRGDMSLVGPRPERPQFTTELAATLPFYRLRLMVRPGLTGLKQIKVGYAATVDEHLEVLRHDLYYIKHRSLALNLLIMTRTLGRVLRMKGR